MGTASPALAYSEAAQEYVRSVDGTQISVTSLGDGPPVVFVHGSLSSGSDWMCIASRLCDDFRCLMLDRRAHGDSDEGASAYCIEREYDDIVAVLEAAGPDVSLIGHSFGAICAMGAALRYPVRRLVLYEPPLPVGGLIAGEHSEPYVRAVEEKRFDDALAIGMEKFVNLPAAHVDKMRSSPAWPRMAAMVPTWPCELAEMDAIDPDVSIYKALTCPTLLVLGGRSAKHPFREAIFALSRTLPDVRLATLPGHGHMGIGSARDLLARQISRFLYA